MKTVFKYQLAKQIEMPKGAKILKIFCQDSFFGEGIKIWAEVETENEIETREFDIVPTGGEILGKTYIDSVELPNGTIFHIYEMGKL